MGSWGFIGGFLAFMLTWAGTNLMALSWDPYPYILLNLFLSMLAGLLHAVDKNPVGRWIATAYVGAFVVWTLIGMVRDVLRGLVGLDILAVVAMVATLAVGEYLAALIIVLMLSGGKALEDFAGRRAKRDLSALLDRSPRIAHVLTRPHVSDSDEVQDVTVDDVSIGDTLLVRPAEILPVDGILLTESGTFAESSLTGESMAVTLDAGGEVLSGAINGARCSNPSGSHQRRQSVPADRGARSRRRRIARTGRASCRSLRNSVHSCRSRDRRHRVGALGRLDPIR